jgi:hypothetical protein
MLAGNRGGVEKSIVEKEGFGSVSDSEEFVEV